MPVYACKRVKHNEILDTISVIAVGAIVALKGLSRSIVEETPEKGITDRFSSEQIINMKAIERENKGVVNIDG